MKTFHIIWWIKPSSPLSTGKNYEAIDMIDAIEQFKKEYPDITPLNVVDKTQMK